MARPQKISAKALRLFETIMELDNAAQVGDSLAGVQSAKIRAALSPRERVELAEVEKKFFIEYEKWQDRVSDAASATVSFYEAYPGLDDRDEFAKKQQLPAEAHIADIVAHAVDGGQQATKGRLLADRLRECLYPNQAKWIEVEQPMTEAEFDDLLEFVRDAIG